MAQNQAFLSGCYVHLPISTTSLLPSKQSILKEINPEYSLNGLMLKLKLQYFGYLIRRAGSSENSLMLRKIEGRRRGRQRMRWLDSITDSMDMNLSKLSGVEGQGSVACCSPWGLRVGHDLVNGQRQRMTLLSWWVNRAQERLMICPASPKYGWCVWLPGSGSITHTCVHFPAAVSQVWCWEHVQGRKGAGRSLTLLSLELHNQELHSVLLKKSRQHLSLMQPWSSP